MFFERMRTGAIGTLWERNFGAEANYSARTKERAKDLEKRRRALTANIRP